MPFSLQIIYQDIPPIHTQKNGSLAANGVLTYRNSNENGNIDSTIQNSITKDSSENMEHISVNSRKKK